MIHENSEVASPRAAIGEAGGTARPPVLSCRSAHTYHQPAISSRLKSSKWNQEPAYFYVLIRCLCPWRSSNSPWIPREKELHSLDSWLV